MLCVCVGDVMDVCVFCLYCEAWSCRCSCMGECECFVMQMLYVCVLCASSPAPSNGGPIYPGECPSHQSCSIFTLMTSQSTMERVTSYTQMIYVSQPQYSSFTEVETTIGDALEELTHYYRSNSPVCKPR